MKKGSSLLRRIYNTEFIEIFLPAATPKRKFPFPDQQNIRDSKLLGLTVYTADMLPVSIVSDNALASLTILKGTFVTLQAYNGENFVWQKPVISLIDQETSGTIQNYAPEAYTGQRVNWPKSYIELAAGVVIPVNGVVVSFEVNYLHDAQLERDMREARFKKQA